MKKLNILIVIGIIVGILACAYFRSSYRKQLAYASDRNITIGDSFGLPKELLESMRIALLNYPTRLFDTDEYDIKSARLEGDWIMISLGVLKMPEDVRIQFEKGEITDWGTPLFGIIGKRTIEGNWEIGLDDTDEYIKLIWETPDWYLTQEAKKIFGAGSVNTLNASRIQITNYKFPWPNGVSFSLSIMRPDAWHDFEKNDPSRPGTYTHAGVDMLNYGTGGKEDEYNQRVISPIDGIIVDICDKPNSQTVNIYLKDANLVLTKYFHIDKRYLEPGIIKGKNIKQGDVVGRLWKGNLPWDDCGSAVQQPNNAHIHWVLPIEYSLTIDGYMIKYPNNGFLKDGTLYGPGSKFVSSNIPTNELPCIPPVSGTWTISQSCRISNTVQYLCGDIIITNNSTVLVDSSGYFDVDIAYYSKLVIKPGSRLIIKPGGKVQ